jgi:hypothetical protein
MEAGGSKSTGPRYRVKLPFGLGHLSPTAILYAIPSKDAPFVRRDGIMVRDETSYYRSISQSPKLDSKYQLLFGTDVTYQFLRLYLMLCSLLSDTREHISTFPPLDDPTDFYVTKTNSARSKKKKSSKLDYATMFAALKKVIRNEMSEREFESLGRKISREKVHQIAALPVLIERCLEKLVKVADEDTLLHLYDYCHIDNVDPVAVRSQCLSVAPDAFYRIQFSSSEGNIRFCHLEGGPLLTSPNDDIDENDCVGGDTGGVDIEDEDMNNGLDTGDDAAMDEDPMDDGDVVAPHDAKRSKLQ